MRYLLACLLLATAAAADDAVTVTYDVRRLYGMRNDAPPVELGLVAPPTPPAPPERGPRDGYTVDALMNFIRDNVAPGSWEGDRTIKLRGGWLIIRSRPEIQRAVARLLARLDAAAPRPLRFELLRVRGPAGRLGGLLRAGGTIDVATLEGTGWHVVERQLLTPYETQRVASGPVRRTPVSTRLEARHGQLLPAFEVLATGRRISLRPYRSRDGRRLRVAYRWAAAEPGAPHPLTLTGMPDAVTLEQPRLLRRRAGGTALLPAGGTAVLAAEATGDAQQLIVLRHLDAPAAEAKPDGETLALFATPFLVVRTVDVPGPAIGGLTLEPPEPPVTSDYDPAQRPGLSRAALIELIKSRVEPNRWDGTSANAVEALGPVLLVSHAASVLARISALLDQLEAQLREPLWVRGVWIGATGERLVALQARAGVDLDAKAVAAIDAGLSADERRADLALALESGQRGHVARLGQARHVAGYAAPAPGLLLPVAGLAQWGALLDVHATRGTGGRVALTVRAADVDPPTWRRVPFRPGLPLQLPTMTSADLETSLEVPLGGGRLVDQGDGRLLLLVAR